MQNNVAHHAPDCTGADPLEAFAPPVDTELDPGIRRAVLVLRSAGIETFESCEGGHGHALPEPVVRFYGNAWEGHKAFAVAMTYGLPVRSVRRAYDVTDGALLGPHWEIAFHSAAPRLATLGS